MPRGAPFSQLRKLVDEAEAVLNERHRVTHAIYLPHLDGTHALWLLNPRASRGREEVPEGMVPELDDLAALRERTDAVASGLSSWLLDHQTAKLTPDVVAQITKDLGLSD